ncbi:threonine/serine exporter family protein [Macrococcus hajekii]|uniref:Threonine/serine exporter family protein n=1 Tax=Macrococcus hajekii TaxID=198482 RepID=A0A4R6BJR7_9STAP|nr:threonine/serine exporter family protein [Macrococcus hajekii]TDM01959.1 threonine/serine exporter family protein [Macrococcus hajekii]GGB08849.1 membrane protein [Macrococcus hajekii]
MDWLINLIFSFTASYFFAVLFDSPKRLFLPSGFVGAAAWMTSESLIKLLHFPQIYGYFFGSIILGVMCHMMARIYKEPSNLFMIPGIIPFVPGGLAYDAAMKMVMEQTSGPVEIILEITLLAGAIASGLLCSDYIFKLAVNKQFDE